MTRTGTGTARPIDSGRDDRKGRRIKLADRSGGIEAAPLDPAALDAAIDLDAGPGPGQQHLGHAVASHAATRGLPNDAATVVLDLVDQLDDRDPAELGEVYRSALVHGMNPVDCGAIAEKYSPPEVLDYLELRAGGYPNDIAEAALDLAGGDLYDTTPEALAAGMDSTVADAYLRLDPNQQRHARSLAEEHSPRVAIHYSTQPGADRLATFYATARECAEPEEVLEAFTAAQLSDKGWTLTGYGDMRRHGFAHLESTRLLNAGWHPDRAEFARGSGRTVDDMLANPEDNRALNRRRAPNPAT